MKNFRNYLKSIESNIPETDKDYYRKVTKPIYEQLVNEVEQRFETLTTEIKPTSVLVSQSQLITGCVDIDDFQTNNLLIKNYFEPIINVNLNVNNIVNYESGDTLINLKINETGYLFSFQSNLPYHEFMNLHDDKSEFIFLDENGKEIKQEVIYKINCEYKAKEKHIKELLFYNRPQESYFDVPICRRFVDVFLYDKGKVKGTFDIKVSNLSGKICIPVWNVIFDNRVNQGSRRNQLLQSEKKVIMPYGMSGEQNQYSISFENVSGQEDIDNIVDGLVKIKDYYCNYFFTKYFYEERVLKLYTSDKKVWGHSFYLYCITKKNQEVTNLLSNKIDYRCLEGCSNLICHQTDVTEAVIHYFANIFYDITQLKVYRTKIIEDNIEIHFVSDNESDMNMDKEYLEFLLELYNSSFGGMSFTGRMVERG